jgi:hypothetical protein
MKNTELFILLGSLSKDNIVEFEKFLRSPYFVNGTSLNKLFKEIIKKKDLLLDINYDKLTKSLCKKLKYSNSTLIKQLSYLSSEIINYLKIKAFREDTFSGELVLNEYLYNKKSFSLLHSNLKKTDSMINDSQKISDKTYLKLFHHYSVFYSTHLLNPGFERKRYTEKVFFYLDNTIEDILLYSYMQYTSIFINYALLETLYNEERFVKYALKIKNFLANINYDNLFEPGSTKSKIFKLYNYMFRAYSERKKNVFVQYRKLVESNLKILDIDLINFHYNALLNFCMMKDRRHEEKVYYKGVSMELFLEYFNKNYFKVNGVEFVNQTEFMNFVGRAYFSKKLDVLKSFIENNASKLRPSEYNDMVNYGFAFYHLGKKEYRKTLKCINSIDKNNSFLKFDLRHIELRIYYELGKIETLIDTVHNYRKIILNDSDLTKADKENLLKFLKYLNALILTNNKTDPQEQLLDSSYYIKQIEKEGLFTLKGWIIEKFENLQSDINSRKIPRAKLINE